jgi:hypothetical protein
MVVDSIEKVGKRLLMVLAQEDETGIGGNCKRLFLETVVIAIHGLFFS